MLTNNQHNEIISLMHYRNETFMFFLSIVYSFISSFLLCSAAYGDVWVFDINDTITIRNAVDPEKTTDVVINQLIAQNTYLRDEPTISLETYIKRTIIDKSKQRETYGKLSEYTHELLKQNIIDRDTFNAMPALIKQYRDALDIANSSENKGFFPSFYNMVDTILMVDAHPTIIFQSFGEEIPLALEAITDRFTKRLTVEHEIGIFDNQHHLAFKGTTYKSPSAMLSLLQPCTVMGWKNNYHANGRKLMFFESSPTIVPKAIKTHFFDDNADRFATIYHDSHLLSIEDGYRFAHGYIYQINTSRALTEENYFRNLVAHHF
jgi:hypothetical protein